jgi:hypothetical protein
MLAEPDLRPFSTPVPAEFKGLARLFRAEVKAVDGAFDHAIATIAAPIRARLKRHPRLRWEQVAGATRIYHQLTPARFRLTETEVNPDRAAFSISEARIGASWMHDLAWNDDAYAEPGVAVVRFSLTLAAGRLREGWVPSAIVSAHALGRRLERARDRSWPALTADLALLLDAPEEGEEVETPDGRWVGAVIPMRGKDGWGQVRAIRTWHL